VRVTARDPGQTAAASISSGATAPVRRRAPSGDGEVLIDPPCEAATELLTRNMRAREAEWRAPGAAALAEVAASARGEFLEAALRYTRCYRDVPDPRGPLFLAGHQPQLFHPGVWLKSFALDSLARRHGGTAVNLVIDSDTLTTPSIAVPAGPIEAPRVERVPYDAASQELPYEHRGIADRAVFDRFDAAVAGIVGHVVPRPFVAEFWPMVVARARETDNLGECLAQARHQWEAKWGLATLECPVSLICETTSFRRFLAGVLSDTTRWRRVYNEALAEFRRRHRIRSANHPAPVLAQIDDWIETPFWVAAAMRPRRRLFARLGKGNVTLSDREGFEALLPLAPGGMLDDAVGALGELSARGIRIRTRALLTTLYARTFLADMFVHGIGGGHYDGLTDALIRRLVGVEPPGFMVISGTCLLPISRPRHDPGEGLRFGRVLRELTYQPERHLAAAPPKSLEAPAATWIERKRRWIATSAEGLAGRRRARAIVEANEALQPYVEGRRREVSKRLDAWRRAAAADSVWADRNYSFCLYPTETLHHFLTGFCRR
jgi:hypothetical protein